MNNNIKKYSIAQKGGLMIEALAMLGLIAVVTPTMYKKSAERTLEVEDINTATMMRTYMNAAESYVTSNYNVLMDKFDKEGGISQEIDKNKIEAFLPYGYEIKKLYGYDEPKVSVYKSGNNLTAVTVFPVKANTNVGQERTARIASLIGASGGYVREKNGDARGVGNLWTIEKGDLGNYEQYSIVTASSDIMNDSTAELNNDKYLQRTKEPGADQGWRNSMRTDLYMGVKDAGSDTVDQNTDMYAIRNIKRLIVGAEEVADEGQYGLYINGEADDEGNTSANAYIAGTLQAAAEKFLVTEDALTYHPETDEEGNVSGAKFKVDSEGNMSNIGRIDLAQTAATNSGGQVVARIGDMTSLGYKVNGEEDNTFTALFRATHVSFGKSAAVSLINPKIFSVSMSGDEGNSKVIIEETGFKGVDGNEGNVPEIKYKEGTKQVFPTQVGSNMKVEGLLAAGQIDTQHLRTASFSSGSENIDDKNKWLTVNENGVHIREIGEDDADVSGDEYSRLDATKDGLYIGGSGVKADFEGDRLRIGATGNMGDDNGHGKGNNEFRTEFSGGNVDLAGANLKVTDEEGSAVLAVRGNKNANEVELQNGDIRKYDVAVHGKAIFTDAANSIGSADKRYMSVGELNENAAVNIVSNNTNDGNIVLVDGTSDKGSGSETDAKAGTVYIRKGLVDVKSADGAASPELQMADENKRAEYGMVRASAFVANNANEKYKYSNPVSGYPSDSNYGNSSDGKYDTYMVNPAYTSVMHDIKLATRGGARLSDILPDFITKGIYIATNNYKENTTDEAGSSDPVSAYAGDVPMPKCPPGYLRVITVDPATFRVGKVGALAKDGKFTSLKDVTKDGENKISKENRPEVVPTWIYNDSGVKRENTSVVGISVGSDNMVNTEDVISEVTGSGTGVTTKTKTVYAPSTDSAGNPDTTTKYLVAIDGGRPITVQESTWLKAFSDPDKSNGVWNVRLGFLYDGDVYESIAGSGIETIEPEGTNKTYYWNLFPIKRGTIEAYVTTYCYFDRKAFTNRMMVDQYGDLFNSDGTGIGKDYGKARMDDNSDYINRLNDPNLKYNEVW